jgi:AcrR family transcriptional regulator
MTPTSAGQDPGTPAPARGPAPAGLIWTRPPKEHRELPAREAIVAAATGLADTHGLDAVSVRRVAAALNTRPMDLYRHFARKDELIDLMADEAAAAAAHHRHRAAGRLQHEERPAASVGRSSPRRWTPDTTAPLQEVMRCFSALGHVTDSPPDLLAAASSNVIAAMRAHGDRRLVVLAPPPSRISRTGGVFSAVSFASPCP